MSTAYADGICICINHLGDVAAMMQFKMLWESFIGKNKVGQKGSSVAEASPCVSIHLHPLLPFLPVNIDYRKDRIKLLGVFLDPSNFVRLNWEGLLEQVELRL